MENPFSKNWAKRPVGPQQKKKIFFWGSKNELFPPFKKNINLSSFFALRILFFGGLGGLMELKR